MNDSLFDLNNIQLQGQKQVQRTQQRQEKELEVHKRRSDLTLAAAEKAKAINDQSMQSAEATRAQQLGVLNGVEEELRRAQEAQALARSDNPLDRVKLWALQQTSQSYNREGNQARINWYTNAAAAVGMGETIRQQGFADQLNATQLEVEYAMASDDAELSTLSLMETQGAQLIDSYRTAQANSLEYLQTQNAMQNEVLTNVSDPQVLKDAMEEAKSSPTGMANIGGVNLTAAKLQDRIDMLDDREYLRQGRLIEAQTNTLATLTLEQLIPYEREARESPEGIAMINNIPVSLAQIDQRRGALKNMNTQELAMDLQTGELIKQRDTQAQERVLRTMTVGELNELIQVHQGIDPVTKQMYDLPMLTAERDRKATEQASRTQTDIAVQQIGDPRTAVTQAVSGFDAIPAAPGSALAKVISDQKRMLSTTASTKLFESQEPTDVLFGAQLVQAAQEAVDSAIAAEAKSMAAGDKNLETAYNYQLRGMPVPAELVSMAVAELALQNKPKDQWLTSGPNGTLSVYNQVYETNKRLLSDPNAMAMSGMSKQEVNLEAHNLAMQAVKDKAASQMTERVIAYQLGDPTNPLAAAKIGVEQFLVMTREADMSGAEAYQKATGASPERMEELLSGADGDPDLAAIQHAHFLMKLDEKKPGLSEAYLAWWKSPQRQQRYMNFDRDMAAESGATFQEAAQWGLIRADIPWQIQANVMQMEQGRNVVMSEQLRAQHQQYVTFGAKPLNQQMFLLQQDRNLNSTEKKLIMDKIITPILQDAERQQMNYQDTTVFLENQLRYLQLEDPTTKRLYNKLMTGRDGSIRILEDFIQTNQHLNHPYFSWNMRDGMGVTNKLDAVFEQRSSAYDWMTAK